MTVFSKAACRALLPVCLLVLLPQAHAVDGVVLIDQNRALAGNVSTGDAPGFPITISQPGSYRLTGNLTPPLGVTAIDITAPGVTLDLNGFTVLAQAHDPGIADIGVSMNHPGVLNVTLRNGHLRGFFMPIEMPNNPPGNVPPPTPVKLSDLPPIAAVVLKDLTLLRVDGQQTIIRMFAPRGSLIQGVVAPRIAVTMACPSALVGSVVDSITIVPAGETPTFQCAFAGNAVNQ